MNVLNHFSFLWNKQKVRTLKPRLIGGAHIREMYSKPLVRKGLRLVSCTKWPQTLGRVRLRGIFM